MAVKRLMSGTVVMALTAVWCVYAGEAAANEFRASDYEALRKQLRAFYPPDGQGDKMTPQPPPEYGPAMVAKLSRLTRRPVCLH